MTPPADSLRMVRATMPGPKLLNQYVVVGDDWLWVDAGIASTPELWLIPWLRREHMTPPIAPRLLVTHADVDHFGGIAALRNALPGLSTLAHPDDARLIDDRAALFAERYDAHAHEGMPLDDARRRQLEERAGPPVRIDATVGAGVEVAEGWRTMHLPGHSAGHLGLHDGVHGRAVIGDAVLAWGIATPTGRPLTGPPYVDVAAYRETIGQLRSLDLRELHTSHFPVFTGPDVAMFLDLSAAAVDAIEDACLDGLRGARRAGRSLGELCSIVAGTIGRWPSSATAGLADPVGAHLAARVAAGDVVRSRDGDTMRYHLARHGAGSERPGQRERAEGIDTSRRRLG